MNRIFTTVDLFAGAGGITEGFRKQGNFKCVCANDHDKCAMDTFVCNHPNVPYIYKDIRELSVDEIKSVVGEYEVDVITGGPPCQGFSLAGMRLADDPRNALFREYVRVTKGLMPRLIFFENVPGIISMQKGAVLKAILKEFAEIGYRCEYRVVNAADYGVPQTRPRFVMLGVRNDLDITLSFPKPTHGDCGLLAGEFLSYITFDDAISDLPQLDQGEGADEMPHCQNYFHSYQMDRIGDRNPGTIYGHKAIKHSTIVQRRMSLIPIGKNCSVLPQEERTKKQNQFKVDPHKPSRTITCNFRTDLIHPTMNRGLTVREAARLQSFDDDYRFFGCLTRKARWLTQDDQVGNAVPPLLAKAFAGHIANVLLM